MLGIRGAMCVVTALTLWFAVAGEARAAALPGQVEQNLDKMA